MTSSSPTPSCNGFRGTGTLLPAFIAKLAKGGSLTVQISDNLDEPSHRLMRKIAADGPWAGKLANAQPSARRAAAPIGASGCCGRAAPTSTMAPTDFHPLARARAVVERVKGAGLRPYLEPLDPPERES